MKSELYLDPGLELLAASLLPSITATVLLDKLGHYQNPFQLEVTNSLH